MKYTRNIVATLVAVSTVLLAGAWLAAGVCSALLAEEPAAADGTEDAADREGEKTAVRAVTPFLMFEGTAEEAMNLYVSLFEGAGITQIERYGPDQPGPEGSVRLAEFVLGEQRFMCIDSPAPHPFTFTPSFSIFVDFDDERALERAFERLSDGGVVLMPLDNYGFSPRFGWVNDRFGVSWQLNLPAGAP